MEKEIAVECLVLDVCFSFDFRIICGAERHHYSMFNVGRSMFDVQSVKCSMFDVGRSSFNIFDVHLSKQLCTA